MIWKMLNPSSMDSLLVQPISGFSTWKIVCMLLSMLPSVLLSAETVPSTSITMDLKGAWQDDGRGFWYQRQLEGQRHEFRFVDLESKTDALVCDQTKLAAALSKELGRSIDPDKLGLERLSTNRQADWFRFRTLGRRWHYNPSTGWLRGLPDDIDPDPPVSVPADTRNKPEDESSLIIQNKTQYAAACYWLSEGMEPKPYGTLQPGKHREQHTYSGHRWKVETSGGLLLAEFTAQPGRQVIELHDPDGGMADPWQLTLDGDTLLLRNLRTKETGQLKFDAARPAGEIRSTPNGDLIAVLVTDKQGTAWRFYEFKNGVFKQMELPDARASAIGKR